MTKKVYEEPKVSRCPVCGAELSDMVASAAVELLWKKIEREPWGIALAREKLRVAKLDELKRKEKDGNTK